ncbi:MAG: Gfo/Idh/MocA family protein [Thermogutta sp.]
MGEKVRFGVIGAGGIAFRKTIPAMLKAKNLRVVAVMDPVNVDKVAEVFRIPRAYTRVEELLADPEVDAVYIASPVNCHLEQIEAAATARKHILCEKPLTLDVEETRQAIDICRRKKVFLQEGYMMKFHGAHQVIRQMLAEGRLGKVVYMRAQLSCWYPPIPGAWRQDPRTGGGGALIDMATHLLNLLEFFAGPIRRLAALTGNLVHSYRSEDASTILAEFRTGAQATIDCFWCIPDEASRTRLEIYGSAGAIFTEGTIGQSVGGTMEGIFGLGSAQYDAAQNKDVVRKFRPIPFKKVNPYQAECEAFAQCILDGRPPEINGPLEALRMARLVAAAYLSAKRRVFVPV